MLKEQCAKCGRGSYSKGKCYADRKSGKPVSVYTYCQWATPPEALPYRILKPKKK